MAKKINTSRRNFLFGAVRTVKNEKSGGPVSSTESCIDTIKAANALYVDEKWEDARLKYKECMEADKNDADVRYRLGVCLYRLERYRQAKLEFERALRIRRDFGDALLYLGLTMVRLNKPEKALALWKQYFNPSAIAVQRELNIQTGFIEQGVVETPEAVAQAVEHAIKEAGDAIG